MWLYIYNVGNINTLHSSLRNAGVDKFVHRSFESYVKINIESVEGYRKAVQFLEANKAEFHTYQIKSDRAFRVVIRGLHHSADTGIVMEELKKHGFEPLQMMPALHPITKVPMPLFFLDLKTNPKNAEIYQLTRLYDAIIKIEPPKPKKNIIQCTRCQQFNHTRNYCHRTPKCVKCDGSHPSEKCSKSNTIPPICTNCKGPHTANYKGCPVYASLQQTSKFNKKTPRFAQQENPPRNTPSDQRTTSKTFAETLRSQNQDVPEPNLRTSPTPEDSNSRLLQKIDQLISLIQPLFSLLTEILPKLIK